MNLGLFATCKAIFEPDAQICANSHLFECMDIILSYNQKKIVQRYPWVQKLWWKNRKCAILCSKIALFWAQFELYSAPGRRNWLCYVVVQILGYEYVKYKILLLKTKKRYCTFTVSTILLIYAEWKDTDFSVWQKYYKIRKEGLVTRNSFCFMIFSVSRKINALVEQK